MKGLRFLIGLMLLSVTMVSFADDKESKELKKLHSAVAKAMKEKASQKDAASAEKLAEAVFAAHPEETGSAHYYLGEMYARTDSKDVEDYPKAMSYLRQSLQELASDSKWRGYANYNIGFIYSKGGAVPQNFDSAYVYYEKAQELDKTFVVGYAKLLEFGMGVDKDLPASLIAYGEGIQAGKDLYMPFFGLKYAMEHIQNGDIDMEAFDKYQLGISESEFGSMEKYAKYVKEAADAGYLPALAEWGTIVYNGTTGVDGNKEEGVRYLKKAADAGYLPALHNYATLYFMWKVYSSGVGGVLKGKQVQKDMIPYYEKAAQGGFPPAEYAMGNTYLNGLGVDVDQIKAYKWLSLSAKHGYAAAKEMLKQVKIKDEDKAIVNQEVEKSPDLIAQVSDLINNFNKNDLFVGTKASTTAEKEQKLGKTSVAEEGALNADFFQSQYNKYGRRVEKELKAESPRADYIASMQKKMKEYADAAAEKGFTIQRNEFETAK